MRKLLFAAAVVFAGLTVAAPVDAYPTGCNAWKLSATKARSLCLYGDSNDGSRVRARARYNLGTTEKYFYGNWVDEGQYSNVAVPWTWTIVAVGVSKIECCLTSF